MAINEWVSKKTNSKIPEFLKNPINCEASIINALFFNGVWTRKFNPKDTYEEKFYCQNGKTAELPFMHGKQKGTILLKEEYSALTLNFGNTNFKFTILMPTDGNIHSFINSINKTELAGILDNMCEADIELSMPKFSEYSDSDLLGALDSRGLDILSNMGFDKIISESKFSVNTFLQSVYIDVNENGAEVASSTLAGGETSSGPGINFKVNKPFIYLMHEDSTGLILFMGTYLGDSK